MRFSQGPFRASSPVRVRAPVFAVGRRVYVACSGDSPARVTLTDEAGGVNGGLEDTAIPVLGVDGPGAARIREAPHTAAP